MVDIVLLVGKFVLLAFLYLFLFAVVRAGLGQVRVAGPTSADTRLALAVVDGPRTLRGVSVPVSGPVVIGRSPGADIVISDDFVSSTHARVTPAPDGTALIEDLDSTNGTMVNGARIARAAALVAGDIVDLGPVRLKVVRA
ncbi:MAG TPA: FHA domain-containing protein [Coriobacteriia bacterium]|nr:FHA domain-containing protein [Coriobacteriia bacterium]